MTKLHQSRFDAGTYLETKTLRHGNIWSMSSGLLGSGFTRNEGYAWHARATLCFFYGAQEVMRKSSGGIQQPGVSWVVGYAAAKSMI